MRVVVVDPSRTVLMAVSRLLASDGHEVTTFVDGRSALACIKSDASVDAVITSAELMTMSGVELCWETRLLAGHDRAIYIILMSSNSEQKHLINALDSGADEFIRKPPAGEELYARLRSAERLLRLQRELIRLATIDPLTGVLNRRAFFDKAQQAVARASATSQLSAVMFDVDHFKQVNDTHGHDVGDQVLRAIAQAAASAEAVVGRLGGEEFAILLEGAHLEAAVEAAERLRAAMAALAFDTEEGRLTLTCSFGVSQWESGETIDQVLKHADTALYEAKATGRNRVIRARPANARTIDANGSGVIRSSHRDPSAAPAAAAVDAPATWWSNLAGVCASSLAPEAGDGRCGSAFVLDDEPQVGALVGKVLETCGIAARQFTAPEPFLEELKSAPPELIVLDLSLGQSDAVEVIGHLEALSYRGKVLLISGRDLEALEDTARIGTAHGLSMLPPLQKPFRPRDLQQRLASDPGQGLEQALAPPG